MDVVAMEDVPIMMMVEKEESKDEDSMDIDEDDNTNNESGSNSNSKSKQNEKRRTNVTVAEEEEARQAIEMLRGDDMSARVAAASKLENVAAALGEERTRKELLPFLTDGADDDDEVLMVIASSLGKLIPHVGGPSHAHTILPPLELLLTVEESTVRQNATESALRISKILPEETYPTLYVEMVYRLATKEWFTARISACALIACTDFSKITQAKKEQHIQHFAALCRDDVPMVRRVAAQNIGPLLQNIVQSSNNLTTTTTTNTDDTTTYMETISNTFLKIYEEFASSDQPDAIRLQTAENSIHFGNAMFSLQTKNNHKSTTQHLIQQILPLIEIGCDDRSWRVRWTAASKFGDIIKAFSNFKGSMDTLVPSYEKLLQDPEAEVKIAAILNMPEVSKCTHLVIPEENEDDNNNNNEEAVEPKRVSIAARLVKKVLILSEDENENVRAAIAMVATEMAPTLGKDLTISQLVPSVLLLLQDQTSEVRLNVISSLGALDKVIGIELLAQSLMPAIINLAEDGKWRIRLAIIEKIPTLAKQLGKNFFSDKLSGLCVAWLGDDIASIRQAAATNLQELAALFGSEWTSQFLMPSLSEIRQHQSYLRRLISVQAYALMATVLEPDYAKVELLPLILDMASDSVPNIRFNVAKCLVMLAPVCGKDVCDSQIRPVLSLLVEDPDRDVRFYANETLQSIKAI